MNVTLTLGSGNNANVRTNARPCRRITATRVLVLCLRALASADCFDLCQGSLAGCLASAHGNPTAEFQCQKNFDDCGQSCLLQ